MARNFDNDHGILEKIDINFYALRKDGEYGGASLWNGELRGGQLKPSHFAINDGGDSRLETCAYLWTERIRKRVLET